MFDGQRPILGVMHQPFTGEFFAGDCQNAHYHCGDVSKPLHVRRCDRLEDAVRPSASAAAGRDRSRSACGDGTSAELVVSFDDGLHPVVPWDQPEPVALPEGDNLTILRKDEDIALRDSGPPKTRE